MVKTRSARAARPGSWVISTTAVLLLAREVEHQLDDDGAGLLVEIAGGLVGQQQPRAW